jgi:hypothetical protein
MSKGKIVMMDQTRTIQTELIANKKNDLQQVLLMKYRKFFFVKWMFYRSSIFAESMAFQYGQLRIIENTQNKLNCFRFLDSL